MILDGEVKKVDVANVRAGIRSAGQQKEMKASVEMKMAHWYDELISLLMNLHVVRRIDAAIVVVDIVVEHRRYRNETTMWHPHWANESCSCNTHSVD
jgi:hypothetical protein